METRRFAAPTQTTYAFWLARRAGDPLGPSTSEEQLPLLGDDLLLILQWSMRDLGNAKSRAYLQRSVQKQYTAPVLHVQQHNVRRRTWVSTDIVLPLKIGGQIEVPLIKLPF